MFLETDARKLAQAYIHGHTIEAPCKIASALIRNLLDDLSAANCEIRTLQRERAALQRRITDQYEALAAMNGAKNNELEQKR